MMSTEPEILPEAFSNPCVSYSENAENFMDEVVKGCRRTPNSLYNNTGYYSESSFDTDSSHHSLILEDPVPGHSQEGLSANNFSHQSNFQVDNSCIKLILASDNFPGDSNHQVAVDCHVNRTDMLDKGMHGSVQVRIECADSVDSNGVNRTMKLSQDLLAPTHLRLHSPCTSSESCGSPTPTPSYRDLVSSPSMEYPGAEEKEFDMRGVEVAGWEEDGGTDGLMAGDGSSCHLNLSAKEEYPEDSVLKPTVPDIDSCNDQERSLLSDVADSHTCSSHDVLPVVPKRRSHLSHLRLMQSPYILSLPTPEIRKLSDPAIHVRRQKLKTNSEPKRQRCLSDSEAPSFPYPVDEDELKSEEGCSSALGCDSGFHDERIPRFHDYYSSPRVSLYSSDLYSLEESNEFTLTQQQKQQKLRRVTPHPQEPFAADGSQSDDQPPSSNPGTMVHPRERSRRSMLKHFSQGSIGGVSLGGGSVGGASSVGASSESPSLSSLLETQSNLTCATDILSSLGFDDFDSPQLVPDRFIPKDLEFLRPSSMKTAFIEQTLLPDPPRSPDSLTSCQSSNPPQTQQRSVEASDLPLGATAENFMPLCSDSPTATTVMSLLEVNKPIAPHKSANTMPLFTDTTAITFTRHRVLETVPEETASDLSLSPRWLSPRVSIDHSVLDLAEGKLGASLQKPRRRSLPSREGYRLSIGSLVESDTGDSIHLSVTSYDDEIAAEREREREREGFMVGICDDITVPGRRRRRGVYTPPQTLLSWLSTQKTIDEEVDTDPDELPWPFNEQARLRKSLTEISLAQQNTLTAEDELVHAEVGSQREVSLSPISTPQPSLSEVDIEELNDLEVEGWLSQEPRHAGMTSHDSRVLTISPDLTEQSIDASAVGLANTDAPACLYNDQQQRLVTGHSVSPSRPQRAPITPLNASRCSLPHLGEGFKSPNADELKLPAADCPNSSGWNNPPAGGLSPLTALGLERLKEDCCSKAPDNHTTAAPTESSRQEQRGMVSPVMIDVKVVRSPEKEAAVHTETSPKNCRSRRPRLGILRQSSLDSQADSLPEDMTEIELLTGDLHSPMLSTRRSKAPFKRQENLEALPQSGSHRSRSSRRVAVIGEAPTAADLFVNTSLDENKSEVGKYMVL